MILTLIGLYVAWLYVRAGKPGRLKNDMEQLRHRAAALEARWARWWYVLLGVASFFGFARICAAAMQLSAEEATIELHHLASEGWVDPGELVERAVELTQQGAAAWSVVQSCDTALWVLVVL